MLILSFSANERNLDLAMDNLFSYLGAFTNFENFDKDHDQILINFPTWGILTFDNHDGVTAEDVAKKSEEACRPFICRLFEETPIKKNIFSAGLFVSSPEVMLKIFINQFKQQVEPVFEDELRFIMIAANEYARSLYRVKITNGTLKSPSKYISVFDKRKREIKKLIEYSGKKFNETDQMALLQDYDVSGKMQAAMTVLPHFIRRFYDGEPSEKEMLMHSVYDIGPVLGLIGVSTKRKNPYLFNVKDDKEGQSKTGSAPASVYSFLNSFSCVAYSCKKESDNTDSISATEALQECKKIAETENRTKHKRSAVDLFDTITAEELSVISQFAVERLVHGCFLSQAYSVQLCLPHQEYFNYYIDKFVDKLMVLPLLRTRIRIMACLEEFIKNYFGGRKVLNGMGPTPAAMLGFMEILAKEMRRVLKFWIEITIPVHILCYHFLCVNNGLEPDAKDYFASIYDKYQFYEVGEDGSIDISKSMNLTSVKEYESQKNSQFDSYARKLYYNFLLDSYNSAFKYNFANLLFRFRTRMPDCNIEMLPKKVIEETLGVGVFSPEIDGLVPARD